MIRKVHRFLKDGRGRINVGPMVVLAVVAAAVSVMLVAAQPWAGGGPTGRVSAQDSDVPWWCEYWAAAFPGDCQTPTPTASATPVDTPVNTATPGNTATPVNTVTPTPTPTKNPATDRLIIGGGTGGSTLPNNADNYVPMFDVGAHGTESDAQQVMPFAGIVSQLAVRLYADPGDADTYTFTVRNGGSNTDVTCTITGNASDQVQCTDKSNTACFDKGDLISILSDPGLDGAVPTAREMLWTAELTPTLGSCP